MSDEKALAVQEEIALQAYGARPEIREMSTRLMAMLPSVKKLGNAGAMALAQAAIAMGLNPFIGEVWAIPQDKSGSSFAIMPGIKGIRRKAHEQAAADNGYYVPRFRSATEEEIEGLRINTGDIVRVCVVTVVGDRAERYYNLTKELPRFIGIGVFRNGEHTKMNPLQCCRKRAEADALKLAFDIPLPFGITDQADPMPDMSGYHPEDVPNLLEPYLDADYYENRGPLTGGDANEAIDDLFGPEPEQTPFEMQPEKLEVIKPPEPAQPTAKANGKRRGPSFIASTVKAVVGAGYAKDIPQATRRLGKSKKLDSNDAPDIVLAYAAAYDQARKAGKTSDEAAAAGDAMVTVPGAETERDQALPAEPATRGKDKLFKAVK